VFRCVEAFYINSNSTRFNRTIVYPPTKTPDISIILAQVGDTDERDKDPFPPWIRKQWFGRQANHPAAQISRSKQCCHDCPNGSNPADLDCIFAAVGGEFRNFFRGSEIL